MSREALSLDISRAVSRVVRGEPVDAAERGAVLAAKYPELGMSAELIGAAITRAAGMVDRMREAPADPAWPEKAAPPPPPPPPKTNGVTLGRPAPLPRPPTPPVSASIDETLASAIDAEIGALVSGQTASQASQENGAEPAVGSSAGGAVARLRRAIFRQ